MNVTLLRGSHSLFQHSEISRILFEGSGSFGHFASALGSTDSGLIISEKFVNGGIMILSEVMESYILYRLDHRLGHSPCLHLPIA